MNFFRRIFSLFHPNIIKRTITMDFAEDSISLSSEIIERFIARSGFETGIKEYLSQVNYPQVKDFNEGLEWFNVSQPLSLEHLKGKLVVLDFFTYCCINCMHILPDLKELEREFSVQDGLVVIGVHSAKFENEKVSSNILSAVQRYNISHPVVNDAEMVMWKNCNVFCWPTLLLLSPNFEPLVMLTGEGNKEALKLYVKYGLEFYKDKNLISSHSLPFKSAFHLLPDLKGPLLFPGKIANSISGPEIVAISDTGNSRILITDSKGKIVHKIGSGKVGLRDGNFSKAEFNNPQGLCFINETIIYVADTENHAIRKIDLKNETVETVAGNGAQGNDREGGKIGREQEISSPWDVALYKDQNMLIIAMAGTHQIWALFLQDTVWWKNKKYLAGSCAAIAGSGREENRNNQYPQAAAFAQPSGLAISQKLKEVYIADSESSSIRRLSLIDGKVTPVVGGNKNPQNLFDFGDKDGTLYDAKLQHSLGLALNKEETVLFVADTYNHKLKRVDVSQNNIKTLSIPAGDTTDGTSTSFKEPAGLCLSQDGERIYLADTNNHFIKILKLNKDLNVEQIEKLDLEVPKERVDIDKEKYDLIQAQTVEISNKGAKIVVRVLMEFVKGLGLTEDAPQKVFSDVPSDWGVVGVEDGVREFEIVVNVPKGQEGTEEFVDVIYDIMICADETCLPKSFIVRLPVLFKGDGGTNKEIGLKMKVGEETVKLI